MHALVFLFIFKAQAAPVTEWEQSCARQSAEAVTQILKSNAGAADAKSPKVAYLREVQSEACLEQKIKNEMSLNPATCAAGQTRLDCAFTLGGDRARVASTIPLEQMLITFAGLKDKETGRNADIATLMMADKLLHTIEDVDFKKFYLATQPNGEEVAALKRDEEKQFLKSVAFTLSNVEDALKPIHIDPSSPDATENWKRTVRAQLDRRLANLHTRLSSKAWHY